MADQSKTATGVGGGLTFKTENGKFSLTGTGYWGKGIGTTLQFSGVGPAPGRPGRRSRWRAARLLRRLCAGDDRLGREEHPGGQLRRPASSRAPTASPTSRPSNGMISGGLYHQATKSLKIVFEGNYMMIRRHQRTT